MASRLRLDFRQSQSDLPLSSSRVPVETVPYDLGQLRQRVCAGLTEEGDQASATDQVGQVLDVVVGDEMLDLANRVIRQRLQGGLSVWVRMSGVFLGGRPVPT